MAKHFGFWVIVILFFGTTVLFLACTKDDTPIGNTDPFYQGANDKIDLDLLDTYWSIYEVSFNQKTAEVPLNYFGCDRDFFTFQADGTYKDFIITDSGCVPEIQQLQWSFEKGVITLSNSFKDFDEMVITELTPQKLIFKVNYDVDEDGSKDIIQFFAKPYLPNEKNFYSNSLVKDDAFPDKVLFSWQPYIGINTFDHYEIYRSTGVDCDLKNLKLVAFIDLKDATTFEDNNLPNEKFFCYVLKVFTDKGEVFETNPYFVSGEDIEIPGITLSPPSVIDNTITLNWSKYQGHYFKQYEIIRQNYYNEIASGNFDTILATISDVETTSFVDLAPPYFKNPTYMVRVRNEFDRVTSIYNIGIGTQQTNYQRPEILAYDMVWNVAVDPTETVVYLNGNRDDSDHSSLARFNYVTQQEEAIADFQPGLNQNRAMQVIQSQVGKELLFSTENELMVFEAQTLAFKYKLRNNDIAQIHDFIYLGGDRYVIVGPDFVYSCSRDFSNLSVLDKLIQIAPSQNYNYYRVFMLDNGRILVGNSEQSYTVEIGSDGSFSNVQNANIPIKSTSTKNNSAYSAAGNYLINFNENRLYSAVTLDFLSSFEQPYYTLGISNDGLRILGANHHIAYQNYLGELQEKQAVIYTLANENLNFINTKGYPLWLFENHLGQIISLSSGTKRQNLETPNLSPDLFFEEIQL